MCALIGCIFVSTQYSVVRAMLPRWVLSKISKQIWKTNLNFLTSLSLILMQRHLFNKCGCSFLPNSSKTGPSVTGHRECSIHSELAGICQVTLEFFLNVFHWIQRIQWQKIYGINRTRTCHTATSCVRDQHATTAPARYMCEIGSLKWAQFMLQ